MPQLRKAALVVLCGIAAAGCRDDGAAEPKGPAMTATDAAPFRPATPLDGRRPTHVATAAFALG